MKEKIVRRAREAYRCSSVKKFSRTGFFFDRVLRPRLSSPDCRYQVSLRCARARNRSRDDEKAHKGSY